VKLKYEHGFHLVAAELVKRAHAGESIDAEMAPCTSSEFSASSSAVIMAIVTMKKSLSYWPAGQAARSNYFECRLLLGCGGGITPFSGLSLTITSDILCSGLSPTDDNCRPAAVTESPCPV
jgi:hypothetical protein